MYDIQWLLFTAGHTAQEHIFGDDAFWNGKFRHWLESGVAYADLDKVVGAPSAILPNEVHDLARYSSWMRFFHLTDQYFERHLQNRAAPR